MNATAEQNKECHKHTLRVLILRKPSFKIFSNLSSTSAYILSISTSYRIACHHVELFDYADKIKSKLLQSEGLSCPERQLTHIKILDLTQPSLIGRYNMMQFWTFLKMHQFITSLDLALNLCLPEAGTSLPSLLLFV